MEFVKFKSNRPAAPLGVCASCFIQLVDFSKVHVYTLIGIVDHHRRQIVCS